MSDATHQLLVWGAGGDVSCGTCLCRELWMLKACTGLWNSQGDKYLEIPSCSGGPELRAEQGSCLWVLGCWSRRWALVHSVTGWLSLGKDRALRVPHLACNEDFGVISPWYGVTKLVRRRQATRSVQN